MRKEGGEEGGRRKEGGEEGGRLGVGVNSTFLGSNFKLKAGSDFLLTFHVKK